MTLPRLKIALTVMQWTLGLVILTEAILFVMPSARGEFAKTHLPDFIRQALGWGELVGALLLLIPRAVVIGGCILVAIFIVAIAVHLVHGMSNVGSLAIYAAAAWTVAAGKTSAQIG